MPPVRQVVKKLRFGAIPPGADPPPEDVMESMKYYLYVLYSPRHKRHYIGISDDPDRRLIEHNIGKVFSTRPYRSYQLVYKEEYSDKTSARKREIFLKKTAKARKELFQSIHGAIV